MYVLDTRQLWKVGTRTLHFGDTIGRVMSVVYVGCSEVESGLMVHFTPPSDWVPMSTLSWYLPKEPSIPTALGVGKYAIGFVEKNV